MRTKINAKRALSATQPTTCDPAKCEVCNEIYNPKRDNINKRYGRRLSCENSDTCGTWVH